MSMACVASSPLMYQFSLAAGMELCEVQLAEIMSPTLYLGRVPVMAGPLSGKSEMEIF